MIFNKKAIFSPPHPPKFIRKLKKPSFEICQLLHLNIALTVQVTFSKSNKNFLYIKIRIYFYIYIPSSSCHAERNANDILKYTDF